jgi:hypothetical protein
LSQAKIHQRHQALAAGENFTVVTTFLEQGKRLIEGLGPVILERCRLQSIFLFLDFRIGEVDLAISSRKSLGVQGTKHENRTPSPGHIVYNS